MSKQPIIVGVDGSSAGHTGLVWALARAEWTGARVRAIRCWMPTVLKAWEATVTAAPVPSLAEQRARAERELDQIVRDGRDCRRAWPVEYHPGPGIAPERDFISGEGHFDIPLRALTSIDTDNLLSAGRNIDGDRAAGSSLRVMGTAFATGHPAGI